MRKIFILLALTLIMSLTIGSVGIAYADEPIQETTQTEVVLESEEQLTELEEIEKTTSNILEYIIAGVLGLFGTSVVAVGFRASLKSLSGTVKATLVKVKDTKTLAEEDIKGLKNECEKTIASLQNVKEELANSYNEEFKKLQREIQMLKDVIFALATGTKELVVNGTAESISNILKNVIKEVNEDGKQKI